jgi:vacuolar protein-sorting-associated protein 4
MMALCCFDPRGQLRADMRRDLNVAFGQYQKAADLQKAAFHRDAYLWYMRAAKTLEQFQTTYRRHRDINLMDKAKELVAEIVKRQPICGQFCLEELRDINKHKHEAFMTKRTAYMKVTLQYVLTDFDKQIHLFPLSNRRFRAVIPEFTMEYSDDSEDERYYNWSPEDAQKETMDTNERPVAPKKIAARRPKRPRVEGEHFKKVMETKQTWDDVKKHVSTNVSPVHWYDIIGYDDVKKYLSSDFVQGVQVLKRKSQKSSLQTQKNSNKSIILYGPPGTGKTQFMHAIAFEATANISIFVDSSKIKSKWSGQAEQNIANIFDMAHALGPSILIFDECEHLMGDREAEKSNSGGDISAIMLAKMTQYQSSVSVVAATIFPWAIDLAFMQRFSKKVFIRLPKESERAVMMKYHIGSLFNLLTDDDYRELGKITDGWTGSDIETLATNIWSFFQVEQNKATHFRYCELRKRIIVYCAPSDNENVTQASAHDFQPEELSNPAFTMKTVLKLLKRVKPVVTPELNQRFIDYHGSEECF